MNELIKALCQAHLYPHTVQSIRVIETHTSYVLLTGSYVYKIKKAVKYGFLDYSTLEARLYYCKKEIEYNSRSASELYLDVVPIYGTPTAPSWAPQGNPIEYAVKMRQFDEKQLFSKLIEKNLLSSAHIEKTAQQLADFHQHIAIAQDDYSDPLHVTQPVAENFTQILEAIDSVTSEDLLKIIAQGNHWFEKVRMKALADSAKLHDYFSRRHAQGYIRACHGDLHLNNILLQNEQPVFFDCVEFNENLRWIDVAAEVAFLTMDLIDKKRGDLANLLLNHYLELTGDYDLITGLEYYQSYRAMVRAKVALLTGIGMQNNPVACRKELHNYVHYLELAHDITQPLPQLLLCMHGYSGSGKSSVSNCLLTLPKLIRLRSDIERKRLIHISTHDQAKATEQAILYTSAHTADTYKHLLNTTENILHAGFSVIVDATFLSHMFRQWFIDLAQNETIPCYILHTQANKDFLIQHLQIRQDLTQPSDATIAVLEQQIAHGEPLTSTELKRCYVIHSDQIPPNQITNFCHDLQLTVNSWRFSQSTTMDNAS